MGWSSYDSCHLDSTMSPSPLPSTRVGDSGFDEVGASGASITDHAGASLSSRPELLPGMRVRMTKSTGERCEVITICHVGEQITNGHPRASAWRVRCLDGSGEILEVNEEKLEPYHLGPMFVRSTGSLNTGRSLHSCTEGSTLEFIRADSAEHRPVGQSHLRIWLRRVLNDSRVEALIGGVILFNFFLICLVTDKEADYPGREATAAAHGISKTTLDSLMSSCFLFFLVELLARVFVEQRQFIRSAANLLDLGIILVGIVEYTIVFCFGAGLSGFSVVRSARLVRLVRLVRVMRLFTVLKELRRLIQMMGSCFKTLFWSFLLLMLVMTIFAVIAVELVNPVVQKLADEGRWENCERCRRSFASTFMANLTFFQTVVAGDSWGYIAVPVIEEYPWTAMVFVGALLTLVFGVLNLIVAVIVDTFAENRENDIRSKALELEAREDEEKNSLYAMFKHIDLDGNGLLSLNEIKEGAKKVADFRHLLRVMDIDKNDLRQLFSIIDEDGNGEVDCTEFIEVMWRMKNADPKTATKFLRYMMQRLDNEAKGIHADLTLSMASLSTTLGRAVQELGRNQDEKSRKRLGTTADMLSALGGVLEENVPEDIKGHVEKRREQFMSSDRTSKRHSRRHSFIVPCEDLDNEVDADDFKSGESLGTFFSSFAGSCADDVTSAIQEHERVIQETVASAVDKVTVEALDEAMKAAAEAARGVLMKAAMDSRAWATDILDDANHRLPEIPTSKKPSKESWLMAATPDAEVINNVRLQLHKLSAAQQQDSAGTTPYSSRSASSSRSGSPSPVRFLPEVPSQHEERLLQQLRQPLQPNLAATLKPPEAPLSPTRGRTPKCGLLPNNPLLAAAAAPGGSGGGGGSDFLSRASSRDSAYQDGMGASLSSTSSRIAQAASQGLALKPAAAPNSDHSSPLPPHPPLPISADSRSPASSSPSPRLPSSSPALTAAGMSLGSVVFRSISGRSTAARPSSPSPPPTTTI